MLLSDPGAVLVADRHDVVASNVEVVNAMFRALLRADEIAVEAVQSYYVAYFDAQVNNGGFSQFVYNSRWNEQVVRHVRAGLIAMAANRDMFEAGADFIAHAGGEWLERYFAGDYFGDNPARDKLDQAVPGEIAATLAGSHATWLRALPNLVIADAADIAAEIERRAIALPDRAARIEKSRAAEPRGLRLTRALCERAGHVFERRTAAAQRSLDGVKLWCYFFLTDRGPHFMIDLGTRAMMFATDRSEVIDASTAIVEIACSPE